MDERNVDVAIIGSGSAGLYALGQVRKTDKSYMLINGGHLGTTCARVGCMPSKALICSKSWLDSCSPTRTSGN